MKLLGMDFYFLEVLLVLGELVFDKVVQWQGLQSGDWVLEINGVLINIWEEWVILICVNFGIEMNLLIDCNGSQIIMFIVLDEIVGLNDECIG